MTDQKKRQGSRGITRRDFIKKTGVAGAALGAAAVAPRLVGNAFAAKPKRDYILIGRPNPATGPLGAFGETSPWCDQRPVDAINAQGGIYIKEYGKKVPVKLKFVDTEGDPAKTAELAAKLILQDKVDLMVPEGTPLTVNPTSAVCERFEFPQASIDTPIEPWLTGGPYEWCYHINWSVNTLLKVFGDFWDEYAAKTNKTIGFFFPNDEDGVQWAEHFNKTLPPKGYKVVDPGRFPFFTFIPKIATVGKALLFPADVGALGGDIPNGLTTEAFWGPKFPFYSSITGETCNELADAWTKATGKQWTQMVGIRYGAMEIAIDILKRAQSVDKYKIKEAIAKTDLKMTIIGGPIKYNKDHWGEIVCVMGQWVKGKKWPWDLEVVYNSRFPEVPITAKTLFPLPA
jgi:branched-chain amino acid transport system substrate-binding protein